jgi:deoxyribose-phosphate aldolase
MTNKSKLHIPDFRFTPTIDKVGVEERVARIQTRSIKDEAKLQGMKMVLNMIDLTTLWREKTHQEKSNKCVIKHNIYTMLTLIVQQVAAVCVYPSMVKIAKTALKGSDVKVASVSTAFPSGQAPRNIKIDDTKFAVDQGADEIDMVISRGEFLRGNYSFVFDEIAAIKEACGKARLKVILETGELVTLDNVRRASEIAMYAGADFIKTSTGKIQPAATMQVTYVMLMAIKDFYRKTGIKIGMKPAGGISTSKLALHNLLMVKETLGEEWLTNEWFRFGASSLANDVLMQLMKAKTGAYQSADYFSID